MQRRSGSQAEEAGGSRNRVGRAAWRAGGAGTDEGVQGLEGRRGARGQGAASVRAVTRKRVCEQQLDCLGWSSWPATSSSWHWSVSLRRTTGCVSAFDLSLLCVCLSSA